MNIGCGHFWPVQDGHGPIEWVVGKNLGWSETVIVNYPSLSLSVQIADEDVSAQALMRERIVESHRHSLRMNTGAFQEHIPQGNRVRQTITQCHFTSDSGIRSDQSRIFQGAGV